MRTYHATIVVIFAFLADGMQAFVTKTPVITRSAESSLIIGIVFLIVNSWIVILSERFKSNKKKNKRSVNHLESYLFQDRNTGQLVEILCLPGDQFWNIQMVEGKCWEERFVLLQKNGIVQKTLLTSLSKSNQS